MRMHNLQAQLMNLVTLKDCIEEQEVLVTMEDGTVVDVLDMIEELHIAYCDWADLEEA